jgi:hypothetical protein
MSKKIIVNDNNIIQFTLASMCTIETLKLILHHVLFNPQKGNHPVRQILNDFHILRTSQDTIVTKKISFFFDKSSCVEVLQSPFLELDEVVAVQPDRPYLKSMFQLAIEPVLIAEDSNIEIVYESKKCDLSFSKIDPVDRAIVCLKNGHTFLCETIINRFSEAMDTEDIRRIIIDFFAYYVLNGDKSTNAYTVMKSNLMGFLLDRGIPCQLIDSNCETSIDVYLKFKIVPEIYFDPSKKEKTTANVNNDMSLDLIRSQAVANA